MELMAFLKLLSISIDAKRKWFLKIYPFYQFIAGTLSLPIAGSGT